MSRINLLILLCFFSFDVVGIHQSQIEIRGLKPNTEVSLINPYHLYGDLVWTTTKADSIGKAVLSFELNKPMIVSVGYGFRQGFQCYIMPNETTSYDFSTANHPRISGSHIETNTFLIEQNTIFNNYTFNSKTVTEWKTDDELKQGFSSLENLLWKTFEQTSFTSLEDRNLVRVFLKSMLDRDKLNAFLKRLRVYDLESLNQVDEYYKNFFNQVTLSDSMSELSPSLYSSLVSTYGDVKFNQYLLNKYGSHKNYMEAYPDDFMNRIYHEKISFIQAENISQKSKDFMIANLFLLELRDDSTFEALYSKDTKIVKHKKLLDLINRRYQKILNQKNNPGAILSQIEGYKLDNELVKLSSLKEKIHYLDIWATWCGPCLKEFESSRKMEEVYRNTTEIQFVYISIDEDKAKWKHKVESGSVPQGLHLWLGAKGVRKLYEIFNMQGIPRYILIDKSGKIINANAPRPSDPKLKALLDELLKQK